MQQESSIGTKTRILGRSGVEVSPMGLGCWAIGGNNWGEVDDEESIRAIRRGLDLGINLIDTANVYGLGRSERVIARALEGRRRDEVLIATKFGYTFDEDTLEEFGENTEPSSIRANCEASLRRLNTDYIDLYQFHVNEYDPAKAAPVRDTLEALVQEGKIRWYGWSTDFPEGARVFAEGEHCTAMQVELNVIDPEPEMTALCDALNLACLNRGPLAMGLLTGKYSPGAKMPSNDVRGENAPDWMKYFKNGQPNPEWQNKVTAVREILTSNGRTIAQGALAWLWALSPMNLPIPGFKTVKQVEENAGARQFGPLTPEQMREIDAILER